MHDSIIITLCFTDDNTCYIGKKRIIYVWYKKAYSICRVIAQTLRNYIRLIVQFFNGLQNNLLSRLADPIFL